MWCIAYEEIKRNQESFETLSCCSKNSFFLSKESWRYPGSVLEVSELETEFWNSENPEPEADQNSVTPNFIFWTQLDCNLHIAQIRLLLGMQTLNIPNILLDRSRSLFRSHKKLCLQNANLNDRNWLYSIYWFGHANLAKRSRSSQSNGKRTEAFLVRSLSKLTSRKDLPVYSVTDQCDWHMVQYMILMYPELEPHANSNIQAEMI